MKVSDEVLTVLGSQLAYHPSKSGAAIDAVQITGQLDRKLYTKVDEVLQACGGKWNRKAKLHLFGCNPAELLDAVLSTGQVLTASDLGFFPTPTALAIRLVKMAEVQPGDMVLEPSAGEGSIVDVIVGLGANVIAIELDLLRHAQLIRGTRMVHDWTAGVHVHEKPIDFMDYEPDGPIDRVVMNPPFYKVGKGDHIDHVRHAFGMLDSGGVLVSVMPQGIVFRKDRKHEVFRNEVLHCGTITQLPEDSFKSSGTGVNTCAIRMVKP